MRRLAVVPGVVLLLLAFGSTAARADTSTDLQQAQQQQQLIDTVRAKLDSNLADALAAQDQLTKSLKQNEEQQQQVQQRLDASNAKLATLNDQVAKMDAEIDATNRRIDTERTQLRSLARAIYVQPGSVLVMLAEAHDLNDLLTRVQDLNSAAARANAVKQALNRDTARIETLRDKVEIARDQATEVRDQQAADLQALQNLRHQQEESKLKLQAKIDQTKAELAKLSSQSADLAQQVTDLLEKQQDEIIAAAMQQVWDQAKLAAQSLNGTISTSQDHSKTYRFIWPEPGSQISQGFGPTTLWLEPSYLGYPHFHTGIDTVLPIGSPVYAADDGIVLLVGAGTTGYGNYVVLEHNGGLQTLYGHLEKALVKAGDRVTQGQPIGLEGSTGNSTGPHLHFELRIDGKPVDPAPYLPPGPPSAFKG